MLALQAAVDLGQFAARPCATCLGRRIASASCRLKRRAAAPFGCTAVALQIPGRYRHVIRCSSIIRPFFGQDCTKCWRLVDPTNSRPSPPDDIGRKREAPMDSTPTPKAVEPDNALIARADEQLAHAHEQIASANEELTRLSELLAKMERDTARPPSAGPGPPSPP